MKIMSVTTVMISGPVMIMMMMSMVESARNTGILAAPLTACKPTGYLRGNIHDCSARSSSECCKAGEKYAQYKCSPPVTNATAATMTWNLFEDNDDVPSCDGRFHNSNQPVVSLSTGWYAGGRRCGTYVEIANPENGGKVRALVVDECDSFNGCDADHDYSPPCNNNDVDASPAVWKALGINNGDEGSEIQIIWSDA